MRLGTGRLPPSEGPDKYHFPVAPCVTINAGDKQTLIDRIFEYRVRQNINPGDIEQDIDKYYCAKWPSFCHAEPSDTDPTARRIPSEPMLNRVSRWVSGLIHRTPRGGFPLVTSGEAEARAGTCVGCRFQDPAWKGGCGGCSATTLQLLQQVKSLRKTAKEGNLSACLIGGWGNSAAVWLGPECTPITDDQRISMPANCWRKQIP